MKVAHTVNIGGIVFNIDEDALAKLELYLKTIESHFSDERERKEIIHDIEARISEIFSAKITPSRQAVTMEDVDEMISIMGNPEEFDQENGESTYKASSFTASGYRRMYRDPDNRVLGGVCGGMGAYWHIDPIIIRIIFVIAFLGFGVGFLIYILLWIVIPEAKTTAQKLEMKGEPVTISNIGRFVKDEFGNVKKNMKL